MPIYPRDPLNDVVEEGADTDRYDHLEATLNPYLDQPRRTICARGRIQELLTMFIVSLCQNSFMLQAYDLWMLMEINGISCRKRLRTYKSTPQRFVY